MKLGLEEKVEKRKSKVERRCIATFCRDPVRTTEEGVRTSAREGVKNEG